MVESVLTLAQDLVELSRLVEDDDVEAVTGRFLDRLVRTVPDCDHAMITVAGRDGAGETVASRLGATVEDGTHTALEISAADPVGEALRFREPRRIVDTETESRWTAFTGALAVRGYRSALVLPVPTEHSPAAVLTLLSRKPHRFDDSGYDVVLLLTLHAGVAFDNVHVYHDSRKLVDNLTAALHSRHVIGQAQGILMHRFDIDVEKAFAVLRRASQHGNAKLRDVARELVAAQEAGDLTSTLIRHGILDADH
ncbi:MULTISPECIES: GAF and ANTAR domain-containing protein [unclassified Saccharothrix]|uniref:GAF and ANTAR domain-containing protein n=1 Tax=unclassified Saccharothrix TaxID=2593673 RepID=UPI00307FB55F